MTEKPAYKPPSPAVLRILRIVGVVASKTLWFIRYVGRENIPTKDSPPYLVVANHQTYIDPVWISLPIKRRTRYMAFGEAFGWPFLGRLIRYLGAFPVSPNPSATIGAMKESLKTLREGSVLVIFPEGAREFADGKFLDFKAGALRVAFQAGVPVLPVTISGGNRIWPQGQKYPRLFRRITVTYHKLMELPSIGKHVTEEELIEWTEKVRSVIAG